MRSSRYRNLLFLLLGCSRVRGFSLVSTWKRSYGLIDAQLPTLPLRRDHVVCSDSKGPNEGPSWAESIQRKITSSSSSRPFVFSALMVASGAALGPFLDSYHSEFGVLSYDSPITATLWGNPEHPALITSWWVPELFGLAGFIIGWLYILSDAIEDDTGRRPAQSPSPPKILIGISIFTFQYWLSGTLFQTGVDRSSILNIMSVLAASGFLVFDGTLSGLFTSAATAVSGPLIEAGLLTLSHKGFLGESGYHYSDPGETGFFPLWILPVYFLGGPAVGNLARGFWNALGEGTTTSKRPYCKVCNDTRRVPCPNCDGVGTYVAMGGRSVPCSSCRGRGYVICRSCFSSYDDDANDIESIRGIMSRMPD